MTPQHKSFHGSRDLSTSIIHSHLVPAHGGELIDLYVNAERGAELKAGSKKFPSWDLTSRQICDLELLLNGGFSPLCGFMTRAEYEGVCHNMRLTTGLLWPIPVVLDVSEAFAKSLKRETSKIALRDGEGVMLAVLQVEDVWQPDRKSEAEQRGWRRVVAFQTRNPMHRAHVELTIRAAKQVEANLLIHPAVGMTKPGDVDYFTRVRCYQLILAKYPRGTAKLSLLPLAMRMGGPREAIWHALIRKNHGCSHLIVGRDHAGPGKDADGKSFYEPYEAQELFKKYEAEIGVTMVPFHNMVYVEDKDSYLPENEVPKQARVLSISGTELRWRLFSSVGFPAPANPRSPTFS